MAGDRIRYEIETYDGEKTQLALYREEKRVLSVGGLGSPPINYLTSTGYRVHGEIEQDWRYDVRTISLAIDHKACSDEDYYLLRRALLDATRPNRCGPFTFRVILPDGDRYEVLCRLQTGTEYGPRPTDRWKEWSVDDIFSLTAFDPFWRELPENVVLFIAGAGRWWRLPFTFGGPAPFRFGSGDIDSIESVTYAGDIWGPMRIIITGPYTYMRLINQTLSPAVEVGLFNTLPADQQAIIDLYPKSWRDPTKPQVRNITTGESLANYLTPQSDTANMRLEAHPIVENGANELQLILTGTTPESGLEIRFYDRWIGI